MDNSIRKHLVWKERKLLAPIWLAFAGVFLMALLVVSLTAPMSDLRISSGYFCSLAYLAACAVGLAMGVVLFSPEREQGTDQLLGSLPISDRLVGSVKLREGSLFFLSFFCFVAVVTALFFWAVYRTPIMISGVSGGETSTVGSITIALIPVECFLWGLICSQRFSRSLYATIAAAVLAMVGVMLASLIGPLIGKFGVFLYDFQNQVTTLVAHSVLVLALAAGAQVFAADWLRKGIKFQPEGKSNSIAGTAKRIRDRLIHHGPPVTYAWKSLGWQLWHTHRWVIGFCVAACVVYGFVISLVFIGFAGPLMWEKQEFGFLMNVNLVFAGCLGAIVGMSTFALDQMGHRFHFFQQQGNHPLRIWMSRVALILLVLPVIGITVGWLSSSALESLRANLMYQELRWPANRLPELMTKNSVWESVFMFLAIASIAQLVSILIRSGMIMVIVAAAICSLAGSWFYYLAWLDVSLLAFGWPIVFACLLASVWYAPRWLHGGQSIRGIVVAFAVVASVTALTIVGLRYHRLDVRVNTRNNVNFVELDQMFEDQQSVLDADPKRFAAALELQRALRESTDLADVMTSLEIEDLPSSNAFRIEFDKWPEPLFDRFIEVNRDAIDVAKRAVSDSKSRFAFNCSSGIEGKRQRDTLRRLLVAESRYQLLQGNIDDARDAIVAQLLGARYFGRGETDVNLALRNLIVWSELKGQTPKSIRSGLELLDDLKDSVFDPKSQITTAEAYFLHLRNRRSWQKNEPMGDGNNNSYAYRTTIEFLPPWELERSGQVFQESLKMHQQQWKRYCTSVKNDYRLRAVGGSNFYSPYLDAWADPKLRRVGIDHTFERFAKLPDLRGQLTVEQWFSYVSIRLALSGYYMEHGRYPVRLSGLKGEWHDHVPVDMFSKTSFAYSATGVNLPVFSTKIYAFERANYFSDHRSFTVKDVLPSNQPFLLPWSGIVFEKREFRNVPDAALADESIEPKDFPLEIGYWLPRNVSGRYSIRDSMPMKDMILRATDQEIPD